MLFIKIEKHNAWHRLFGNATPKQIRTMLKHFEEDFKLVFGNASFEEAAKIIERLLIIKEYCY